MNTKFPIYGSKNVGLYYLLTIFMNGWFILPNWVFYFAQFITIPQIGLIDGLSKLVAVVLEVPSGAMSDLLGKKATLIVGNVLFAVCSLILILSSTFTWLLIGNIIMFIGFACVSGAKEAIIYDSLIEAHSEHHYDEVLGRVNSLAMATSIMSIFVGGWLYGISPGLTFVAWVFFSLISIAILLCMNEPKADKEHLSFKTYFQKLQTGFSSIFHKPLISFVLPVLFFSMLIKAYEGVIRQTTGAYFGFTGETFGYMLAIISLPTLLVSYNYGKFVKVLKNNLHILFSALYFLGFLIVYVTNNLYFGIFSFLSVYVAQEIAKPFVISLINKNTQSKHRATTISTVSLFSELPYMIVVIFLRFLLELDKLKFLYAVYALMLVIYVVISSSKTIRYKQK